PIYVRRHDGRAPYRPRFAGHAERCARPSAVGHRGDPARFRCPVAAAAQSNAMSEGVPIAAILVAAVLSAAARPSTVQGDWRRESGREPGVRVGNPFADTVDNRAVNAVVYNGWKMFEVYCTRCHGEDAVGSSFAPALIKSVGPDGT